MRWATYKGLRAVDTALQEQWLLGAAGGLRCAPEGATSLHANAVDYTSMRMRMTKQIQRAATVVNM